MEENNEVKNGKNIADDITKKEKPPLMSKVKKNAVLLGIFVVSGLFIYGFIKGTEPEKPKQQAPSQNEVNLNDVQGNVSEEVKFPDKYEQKKNVYKENFEEEMGDEFIFPDNNYVNPNIANNFVKAPSVNPMMEEYYSTLFNEEMNARKSEISFSNGNNNNQKIIEDNGIKLSSQGQQQINPFAEPDMNRQADKRNFFKNEEQRKIYNSGRELYAVSPYEVKAGTYIPGILISGINSDLPGNMKGQVREDVYDTVTGNHLLIPKGTTLIGTYDSGVTFGQDRALVVWQRLIFPNGKTVLLDNMGGVDLSGYAGFKDKVDNHNLQLFKAVVLSSILGAGTAIVSDDEDEDSSNDWQGEAGRGAGEQVIMIGNRLADKLLALQPTITIRPGYRFNIMLHSDLVLTPYER